MTHMDRSNYYMLLCQQFKWVIIIPPKHVTINTIRYYKLWKSRYIMNCLGGGGGPVTIQELYNDTTSIGLKYNSQNCSQIDIVIIWEGPVLCLLTCQIMQSIIHKYCRIGTPFTTNKEPHNGKLEVGGCAGFAGDIHIYRNQREADIVLQPPIIFPINTNWIMMDILIS